MRAGVDRATEKLDTIARRKSLLKKGNTWVYIIWHERLFVFGRTVTYMVQIKDAGLQFRNSLSNLPKSAVEFLVMHHMAHTSWDVQEVHNYHRNGNGWAGIGYHFFIAFDGTIYKGRGLDKLGVHAAGVNSKSLGIGFQGNFESQQMTDAQVKSAIALIKHIYDYLGKEVPVKGHNEAGTTATACPGRNFRMSELKAGLSGNAAPAKKQAKAPKSTGNFNGSIVDYLNQQGKDSSFAARKQLAIKNGIPNYTGTANQNTLLLERVRSGGGATLQPARRIAENGVFFGNEETIRALQAHFGTQQTGKISPPGQSSNLILAMQRFYGSKQTGNVTRNGGKSLLWEAAQRYHGTQPTGRISNSGSQLITTIQRQINAGTYPQRG